MLWALGDNWFGARGVIGAKITPRHSPVRILDNVKIPSDTLTLPVTPPVETDPQQNGISVTLNGTNLSFDQPPIIESGRTLVPLRAIFEALGAEVHWDEDTQTVTAVRAETTVILQIGSTTLTVNGQTKTLDVPARIVGGRSMVPARAVSESFDTSVDWDNDTQKVILYTEFLPPLIYLDRSVR